MARSVAIVDAAGLKLSPSVAFAAVYVAATDGTTALVLAVKDAIEIGAARTMIQSAVDGMVPGTAIRVDNLPREVT